MHVRKSPYCRELIYADILGCLSACSILFLLYYCWIVTYVVLVWLYCILYWAVWFNHMQVKKSDLARAKMCARNFSMPLGLMALWQNAGSVGNQKPFPMGNIWLTLSLAGPMKA